MTAESQCRFIYVTTSGRDEALKIGRFLVQQRLVACANVLGDMRAIFWWEGKVKEGEEAVLIAKTTVDRVDEVLSAVKEQHSYDCPCAIALPIFGGLPAYLGWIQEETHAE